MVTLCWAAKGGSGTTVVASALALESTRPALLVDLAGDVPMTIGLDESTGPGALDWLIGSGPGEQLDDLLIDIDDLTTLLPTGTEPSAQHALDIAPSRWVQLASWMAGWAARHDGETWVDSGTGTPCAALADAVDERWLVTRPCYLSLRRASQSPIRPTGVLVVSEPGRSLSERDVERATGAPIMIRTDIDPAVARAVDAGLMLNRVPRSFRRELRRADGTPRGRGIHGLDQRSAPEPAA